MHPHRSQPRPQSRMSATASSISRPSFCRVSTESVKLELFTEEKLLGKGNFFDRSTAKEIFAAAISQIALEEFSESQEAFDQVS
ncbi:hypothetical protein L596_013211 [Steinernema carpocapsae]|uniref:Uncharacterized protein n=1 Tax=Steinernema carpocapsae TaxID=34508 RepID=A0A4U5P044_STECR|nr:hypothetical protein L596_013211 [Steinernema carpocapsae]